MAISKTEEILSCGTQLVVERFDGAMPERDADAFFKHVNTALDEPFLRSLLLGEHAESVCVFPFRGMIKNALVSTGWIAWSKLLPDVAVMAGVTTVRSWRKRGIGRVICKTMCDFFEESGGKALYLAAAAPTAERIYESLGFDPIGGQAMCKSVADYDLNVGYDTTGAVKHDSVNWGDMGGVMSLYMYPHECVLVDCASSSASTRVVTPFRCTGLFWNTWRHSIGDGGTWQVLRNDGGWVVASVVGRPVADAVEVDFIWHPNYEREAHEFLAGCVSSVEREFDKPVRFMLAQNDKWKRRIAQNLGFRRESNVIRKVSAGDGTFHVVAMQR